MITVTEALRRIKKLCAIESEGAQLIYFRHCIETAVEEEREACAKIADENDGWSQTIGCPGEDIAAAIRARSERTSVI